MRKTDYGTPDGCRRPSGTSRWGGAPRTAGAESPWPNSASFAWSSENAFSAITLFQFERQHGWSVSQKWGGSPRTPGKSGYITLGRAHLGAAAALRRAGSRSRCRRRWRSLSPSRQCALPRSAKRSSRLAATRASANARIAVAGRPARRACAAATEDPCGLRRRRTPCSLTLHTAGDREGDDAQPSTAPDGLLVAVPRTA
jgi:hypothetical protein